MPVSDNQKYLSGSRLYACIQRVYTKIQGPRFQRNYIIARYRKSDLHGTSFQSTTSVICMTIQTHTVLQKLCLGIKITTQSTQLRYFDNNLSRTSKQAEIYFMNCILIKYLDEFISSLIKPFILNWVIFGIRVLTL